MIDYEKAKEYIKNNSNEIFPRKVTHFINGDFQENYNLSQVTNLNVVNPSTEEIICNFHEATELEIESAINAAESGFREWNEMEFDLRVKLFMKLADKVEENFESLSILESIDNGKTFKDACEDIQDVAKLLRYYGGFIDKLHGSTISAYDEYTTQTRRTPYGIVACITPWNYPLLMATWKIIPALCAGNAVILKPSEETPLTILKFCEFFNDIGFPKGFLNVLLGRGPTTGSLITHHPKILRVCFIGSTLAGRQIMKASSDSNLKSAQLELGGKSPLIVFDDADLENALKNLIDGSFFNSSQNCMCSSRILIQEGIYNELIERIIQKTKGLKVGRYDDPDVYLGPLINKRQYDNYFKYLQIANEEKLKLGCGGNSLKDQFEKGYYVEPTVFTNVPDNSRLAREEIFAPILCILTPFKTAEEALRRANDSTYGLGAGVFTKDINRIEYFVRNLQTGNVQINCYNLSKHNVPFGGVKQSGFGKSCGVEGIMEFTQIKTVYYYNDFSKI